jgi:hypothetical protein
MKIQIISKKSINNISIDMTKEELAKINYSKENIFINFRDNFISSISVQVEDSFLVDNQIVNLSSRENWYEKENPYFDGEGYIFPERNLATFESNNEYEITLYSDKIRDLYERNLANIPRFNELKAKKILGKLYFEPYIGLGEILFGMNRTSIASILGKPLFVAERKNNVVIETHNSMILRFDNNFLSQIHINNPQDIFYENFNLSLKKDIKILFNDLKVIVKKSYHIIPDLGIAFSSLNDVSKDIYLFDISMKENWTEFVRPITSW